jgi:hypothetical protein
MCSRFLLSGERRRRAVPGSRSEARNNTYSGLAQSKPVPTCRERAGRTKEILQCRGAAACRRNTVAARASRAATKKHCPFCFAGSRPRAQNQPLSPQAPPGRALNLRLCRPPLQADSSAVLRSRPALEGGFAPPRATQPLSPSPCLLVLLERPIALRLNIATRRKPVE